MHFFSYSSLFFSVFVLDCVLGADITEEVIRAKSTRPRGSLTGPDIDALPAYDTIRVATIHYTYDANDQDVPQVKAELAAMQHIFQQYGASVRDIAIPKGTNAQSDLETKIKALYEGLSAPGSLVIIIYGGHGRTGGLWASSGYTVDWKSIDTNIIAGTGIDTFQIIDACYAGSSLPTPEDENLATYSGRGAFDAMMAANAISAAGINELAFTKAVIYTLAPADGAVPANFTPASLYRALPVVNQAFAEMTGDGDMKSAMLSGAYEPQFFSKAYTAPAKRKISVVSC